MTQVGEKAWTKGREKEKLAPRSFAPSSPATDDQKKNTHDTTAALGILLSASGLSSASGCASVTALEVCLQPLQRVSSPTARPPRPLATPAEDAPHPRQNQPLTKNQLGASLRSFPNLVELSLLDVDLRSLPTAPGLGASCPCLERLWLSCNALAGAFPPPPDVSSSACSSPIRGLTRLTSLCLRQNALERLDAEALARDCPSLASLDLGGNRLRRLDGLSALKGLTELQAPSNALERPPRCCSTSDTDSTLPSLRVLNLAGNPSPASLRQLGRCLAASFPMLEELWLADPLWTPEGCPVAALGGYASAALASLPAGLRRLDGLPVPERARAAALEARGRARLARGLLRRELERRCFLVVDGDEEQQRQRQQQERSLLERACAGIKAAAGWPSSSSLPSSSSSLLARAAGDARRALRRALRRAALDNDTHGSVRIEEVDHSGGLEALLRGDSTLLPEAAAANRHALSHSLSGGAAAQGRLRVRSAARVRSRALALAFESRLRQRLLPQGTAYLGPGTPAVAAVAARGGVVPAALAAEGGAHVRTLLFVLPDDEGSSSSFKEEDRVCVDSDDEDEDDDDDREMRALEAIAELGFVGAAAEDDDGDAADKDKSPWVRLLSSLPPLPSSKEDQRRRTAVMVVRAYVGAEGKGHVRAAVEPPARRPPNGGAVAVRVTAAAHGEDGAPDVWWHCDPSLVLPIALLELSFAEDEGEDDAVASAAAAAPSAAITKADLLSTRAIPSSHSLHVTLSAVQRELEPWIAIGDAAAASPGSCSSSCSASAVAAALAEQERRRQRQRQQRPGRAVAAIRDLDYSSLEALPELDLATTRTRICARGNPIEATAKALAPLSRRAGGVAASCLVSLKLSWCRLSDEAPELWRALGNAPGLTRLELNGNRLKGFAAAAAASVVAPEDGEDNNAPRFSRPLLPALRVLGLESNCFESLLGIDRVAGPALEQLHARGNPRLASPAAALAPLSPAVLLSRGLGAGSGGPASGPPPLSAHPFPRLEVLDLRGSAVARGCNVPPGVGPLLAGGAAERRPLDYRLYALHLLHQHQQHDRDPRPHPQLLVLDGRAVTAGERDEAARRYRCVLTREALGRRGGGGGFLAAAAAASETHLSLRGWRLRSTGSVFSGPEAEEEEEGEEDADATAMPRRPPPPPLVLPPSRLVDLDLSGNRLTAVNPHLGGLVCLTRLVLDDNRLGGGGGGGGGSGGGNSGPALPPQQLSFERAPTPGGGKRSSRHTPLFPALVSLSLDNNGLASLAPLRLGCLHRSLRRLSARGNALSALEEEGEEEEEEGGAATSVSSRCCFKSLASLTGLEELLLDGNRLRRWRDTGAVLAAVAAAAAPAACDNDEGAAAKSPPPAPSRPLLRLGLSDNGIRSLHDMPLLERVWELRVGEAREDRVLADPSDAEALAAAAPALRSVWIVVGGGGEAAAATAAASEVANKGENDKTEKQQQQEEQQRQLQQQRRRQQRVLLAARCGPKLERIDGLALTPPEREAAAALTAAERAAAAAAVAAVAEGGDASAAASAAARAAAAVVAAVVAASALSGSASYVK
jgi:Leucine-rich repeat (LRR) protein